MAGTQRNPRKEVRRPVWAEVSLGALAYNLEAIRKYVNPPQEKRKTPRKILSIVKGNGYGHGGPEVAKALEKAGSNWFGVTCTDEGIAVRRAGVRKPILILTSFVPGEESRLVEHDLTAVIHRCEQLALLDRAAARRRGKKRVEFHLKIDTGMNRLGIASGDVECFARQLGKCKNIQLTGIFSHFASSGVFTESFVGEQTGEQEERFYAALDRLRALGIDPGIVHLANSAAIVTRPETWADMVRPGAILYGYHPGYDPIEKRDEAEARLPLKPVMSLRSRIMLLKGVPKGERLGYGCTFETGRDSIIATLPIGYDDGYSRALSNRGRVIVRDTFAPVVGRVSMDLTLIDVTEVPDVSLDDKVTLLGRDGELSITAEDIAETIGTISYEVTCGISARVPRVYSDNSNV